MKFYHIALIVIITLFSSSLFADSNKLPYCQEAYCAKVLHDKTLEKATAVVWKGKDEIITAYSFDLDKSAKLMNVIKNNNTKTFDGDSYFTVSNNDVDTTPPAGCVDTCTKTVKFKTTTEIVYVTYIFYVDASGNLLDIETKEKRIPRNDTRIEQ